MKKILLPLLIAALTIISCQKEINETLTDPPPPACRITKGHYYGGGGMHDSARFTYDASGRLVQWQNMDGKYVYSYSGNQIRTRIYTSNSGEIWFVDSIRYNADNTLADIISYDMSGWYGPDTIHTKVNFQYQNNRVSGMHNVLYFDYGWGPETDTTFTTLTWDAAGNIVKILFDNFGFEDSVEYRYDTSPNYFKAIHPHFFLFDSELELQVGFETKLAYFYSRNNVSNINIYGTWDYPIVYGVDSTNKVTSIDMGGFPYVAYEYECD